MWDRLYCDAQPHRSVPVPGINKCFPPPQWHGRDNRGSKKNNRDETFSSGGDVRLLCQFINCTELLDASTSNGTISLSVLPYGHLRDLINAHLYNEASVRIGDVAFLLHLTVRFCIVLAVSPHHVGDGHSRRATNALLTVDEHMSVLLPRRLDEIDHVIE